MTNTFLRIMMKLGIIVIILFVMTLMRMSGVPLFIGSLLGFGAIAAVLRYKSPKPNSEDEPKLKK
jgi:hypothetical protein